MRKIYFLVLCFFTFGVLSAQEKLSKEEQARREKNIQAGNPFAKFGYKAKVATLSKGKYLEVHDLDSIVTIGSVRYHVDKNQIVGTIVIDTTDMYARPIGDIPSRWLSPDPLSEEFSDWSPYTMCFDNPIKFIDPDGRAPVDWIKNIKTGAFEWRNEVTSVSNTPQGYTYIGKSDNSIVKNLFGQSNFSDSTRDMGTIGVEDFDNPHSAKGYAIMTATTETILNIHLSADIEASVKNDVLTKEFKGINISATVIGNANAPGAEMFLTNEHMNLQGNKMNNMVYNPNGEILPRGNVPTLAFKNFWNSQSINKNFNKSFNLNFDFKGAYNSGNNPMTFPTAVGVAIPVTNYTNISLSVPFKNK